MSDAVPIAVLPKNKAEEIRISLSEYNGHNLINVRVWSDRRNGNGEGRVPTKAGIACRVVLLPALIAALQKAEQQARAAGLLS
jgi:Transcriptional Coactivator p15 (PC4)